MLVSCLMFSMNRLNLGMILEDGKQVIPKVPNFNTGQQPRANWPQFLRIRKIDCDQQTNSNDVGRAMIFNNDRGPCNK